MEELRIVEAPSWGLTLGAAGKSLVFTAIFFFLAAAVMALLKRDGELTRLNRFAFFAGTISVAGVFGILVTLLMTRQYQFEYVFNNTQNNLPGQYRFSAAWASQEGSFLLWTLTSAFPALIIARLTGPDRRWFTFIAAIFLAAMLGIVAYESPFKLAQWTAEDLQFVPEGIRVPMLTDGRGLNPVLENYWMAIHPWVIFVGFGSLLSLYSWAIAVAISRDWKSWALRVRPFGIFCSTVLGIGLTMGGLWAYETLGWGGFWAWDPVENVSLVPFLASVAFMHASYVQLRRGVWSGTCLILGALPFFWFAYGTFLTRSGVLADVSVHSFARMNEGAHGLLLGLVIAVALSIVALAIWVFIKRPRQEAPIPTGDRQTGFILGIGLIYAIALVAAIGMSVPFFSGLAGIFDEEGKARIVEEAAYNRIVAYPFIPAMLLMAIVPFLGWTKTQSRRWSDIASVFVSAILITIGIGVYLRSQALFRDLSTFQIVVAHSLILACTLTIIGSAWRLIERATHRSGRWAQFLMHGGIALLLLGLIASRAFEKDMVSAVAADRPTQLIAGPTSVLLKLVKTPTDEEWVKQRSTLQVEMVDLRDSESVLKANVAHYFHVNPMNPEPKLVSRPAIFTSFTRDLYLSFSNPIFAYADPVDLAEGDTKKVEDVTITYVERTRYGEAGQSGTLFGTKVKIEYNGKSYDLEPHLELVSGSIIRHPAKIGEDLIVVLDSLQAESGVATFSIQYPEPFIPVQLFYKPFTLLVWLGAGIMTIGGLLTMFQVRPGRNNNPKP